MAFLGFCGLHDPKKVKKKYCLECREGKQPPNCWRERTWNSRSGEQLIRPWKLQIELCVGQTVHS